MCSQNHKQGKYITPVDFGRAASDYATHRAGFPTALYEEILSQWGLLRPNAQALDLGCGTGTIAIELARRGMRVVGIDPSEALLRQAKQLSASQNLFPRFVRAKAEELPVAASSQDLIVAGQCWHWFERERAAAQCRRALKPSGSLVIAHFDFLASDPIVAHTLSLVRAIGGDPTPGALATGRWGLYPEWFIDLERAGLLGLRSQTLDLSVPYTQEAWIGRMVASAGVGATRLAEEVARFRRELADFLRDHRETLRIPHRLFALVGQSP